MVQWLGLSALAWPGEGLCKKCDLVLARSASGLAGAVPHSPGLDQPLPKPLLCLLMLLRNLEKGLTLKLKGVREGRGAEPEENPGVVRCVLPVLDVM